MCDAYKHTYTNTFGQTDGLPLLHPPNRAEPIPELLILIHEGGAAAGGSSSKPHITRFLKQIGTLMRAQVPKHECQNLRFFGTLW